MSRIWPRRRLLHRHRLHSYNAEGTQLFTATDYVTIRTPTQLEMTVDGDTEIYYDGREHTVALDGLEEGETVYVQNIASNAMAMMMGVGG